MENIILPITRRFRYHRLDVVTGHLGRRHYPWRSISRGEHSAGGGADRAAVGCWSGD